ncbi:MAG: AAA family ATPase, partial [Acidobacteria bacterium]|nr:AAA family ATPase [Acidobacteriota bacterium]
VQMKSEDFARLLSNLKGLTLLEAERILTKAIVEDGKLAPDDLLAVVEAKKAVVEREGVLEYFPAEEGMADIADLAGLKAWLSERRAILTDPSRAAGFGLAFPKGVLLLGVPGCGKSLCAKAVAREWGLPLLKLDPASLYNKYVGESEKNFKRAMSMAEKLAPTVLWIDELEKAFSSSGDAEDGGLSQRIFGTFLSWLQDRKGDVFVVATANDVSILPPEFLRKGRFDEIFFVDLPDAEARRALFSIHLKKRGKDPKLYDLPRLVEATEGFGGSEVEQAIVAGLYTAFSGHRELSTETLLLEIARTKPMAQTMGEKIQWLRDWAKERTRSAH